MFLILTSKQCDEVFRFKSILWIQNVDIAKEWQKWIQFQLDPIPSYFHIVRLSADNHLVAATCGFQIIFSSYFSKLIAQCKCLGKYKFTHSLGSMFTLQAIALLGPSHIEEPFLPAHWDQCSYKAPPPLYPSPPSIQFAAPRDPDRPL